MKELLQHPEARRQYRLFQSMKPGAVLIYHVGHLATDAPRRPDLQAVRALMTALHERGLCRLSQRRIDDGCYHYLATKALPPAPAQQPQG